MNAAKKLAKLCEERGTDKPCRKSETKRRSESQKRRWALTPREQRTKPKQAIKLSRIATYAIVREWDAIADEVAIYQAAWTKQNLALCVQMRENAKDRLFGKPFVSINPDTSEQAQLIYNDKRLQVAIQTLLPPTVPPNVPPKQALPSVINTIDSECSGLQTHNTDEDKT